MRARLVLEMIDDNGEPIAAEIVADMEKMTKGRGSRSVAGGGKSLSCEIAAGNGGDAGGIVAQGQSQS